MSQESERRIQRESLDLESGLAGLRQSPEFRGPVESLDEGEHANDHFALVYEDRDEQFAAAVPFVRQGLERGERCLYVADENSREEVLDAMRARDVDVDAALESGALTVHTKRDTYCRDGESDPDDMIAFLEDAIAEADEEDGALRVAGEMTWLLGEDSDVEALLEYEARLDRLFHEEDSLALCQYNRERFPAAAVRDVVKTHPHLICDNTLSQNFYYTPPEELLGPEDAEREVDRMMKTLRDRTEAKTELRAHKHYLRELYETTASDDLSFDEKVEKLLEIGCERFDLGGGALSYLPSWDGNFRAEVAVGSELPEQAGGTLAQPGEGCFCREAITRDEPTAVPDVAKRGWGDDAVFQDLGVRTYFGIRVTAGVEPYGTLWFYDTSPRDEPFTDDERTFLELLSQWVSDELERTERNRAQRELYDITADGELPFDEKVEQLLDLGRERFGLDVGFLLEERGEEFEVVKARGTDLEEGVATVSPNPDQFCKRTLSGDVPLGVEDTAAAGWDDDSLYDDHGLSCYLGTKVTDGVDVFGTVCFADTSSREDEFTDAEYTFLDLMGQWLSYELDREKRERYLREQNEITAAADRSFEEKLQGLFDLGCERFGLELGAMAFVDPETDGFEIEYTSADHEYFTPGTKLPLSETYCTAVTERKGPASVSDPIEGGYEDITVHREFGLKAYLGTYVEVEGDRDRTFFFVTDRPRDQPFSEAERTFHNLLGQWVKYGLERRRREADLQESKERFKRIFESSQDAILIFDPGADEFLDANPAASEMVGYSRDELLSIGPADVHPHDLDKFRAFTDRVSEDGAAWTDELTCQTKNGGRIPTEISASQIEYDDRSAVLAVVRDISDRVERKRELERVERQFEATFNNPVSFMGLLDPDGTVRRANENAVEFAGVEESDVRGGKFWDAPWFAHSEDVRAQVRDGVARAADGEYVHTEIPHRSPEGDTVVMDSILEPVHDDDGEVIGIVPSGHDVTELKQRERFQRKLSEITADPDRTFEEKLRAMFELGCERFDLEHGGIARIDRESDLFEVETILGDHEHLVPGERYPLSETYCRLTPENDGTTVVTDPVGRGFEGKLCYDQFGVRTYLGTHLELEESFDRILFFVSNEPRDESFSEADRTFHRLMGEWVRKEFKRDQHQTQLQRKNDRLESFASLLAHELRNPVTIGQIYSQQLPDEADAEAVGYVAEAFDRIEDMIDVMLVLTRGRDAVDERTSVELAAVVRAAWDEVDAPDATLDVATDRTIQADATYVRHLFRNLLENAVEHGGPDVTVTVGDLPDGFYVADDGAGICTDDRDAVFEAGYTTAADNGGTGLGLAFVQKLAEVYQWDYTITESESGGARFEFGSRDSDSR